MKVSLKSRKTMACETYDDQGLAINAMHLKILHALKVRGAFGK